MKLRHLLPAISVIILSFISTTTASAQYYEIANRLPQLLSPAISGSGNYKGFIEAAYEKTIGNKDADFAEFSTSQGYQYGSLFFMGVGLGVDVLFAHPDSEWGQGWNPDSGFNTNHSSTQTAAMMPLFTDFRLAFGSGIQFFIDLKIGCSFLLGKRYIEIGNGYLTNQQYFYLRPAVGLRIPTSTTHPKQAVCIGVTYKLLTSNYWNSWSRDITLNSLGATIAFEW